MRVALRSCMVVLILVTTVYAQHAKSPDRKLPDIVDRMENGDLATRKAAFDELMASMAADEPSHAQSTGPADRPSRFFARHPEHADRVKLGLIHLLTRENYLFVEDENPPDNYSEDDSEHYVHAIEIVSSLDDERTIPALVGAMTTGGIATKGLLKYGDKALGPVLDQLKNPNPMVRSSALDVAVTILRSKRDRGSQVRMNNLIQSSLRDSESIVRGGAVMLIGCLGDRQEFVPILEQLAKNDPAKLSVKADDDADGGILYPVRHHARVVLRDIQNNKQCTP